MVRFILNEKAIETNLPPGMVLLDFIRYHQHLPGTKIGCREGDCGACTVLVGELKDNRLQYESMTCCLMPLGNAQGKHIVTVEGINPQTRELNPIQKAMADEGATQCGFCTPGFVMSLAGFCLSGKPATRDNVVAAVDGNICRCTGYKSIERAAVRVADLMKDRKKEDPAQFAAQQKILPDYFSVIKERLFELNKTNGLSSSQSTATYVVGGGTDLYVQKHDEMTHANIEFTFDKPELNGITRKGNRCIIGPSVTVTGLKESAIINEAFPKFQQYAKLISSTPIRNMATIAGNFINASPIGDFTIFFLALDARITFTDSSQTSGSGMRSMPLRNLYKGYKTLDRSPKEIVTQIDFELPGKDSFFHFEKVSKRTNLDIASVNSAINLTVRNKIIETAGISAGGVAPIPLFLQKTSAFLTGKSLSEEIIHEAIDIVQTEVSPISDARGTADYKRLLLSQLVKAHFITLFPALEIDKLVLSE